MASPAQTGLSRKDYLTQLANFAHSYGFVPIPLKGKIPTIKGWPDFRNDPDEDAKDIAAGRYPANVRKIGHLVAARVADNFGILTGEASGVVVLDIDVTNDGLAKWNEMVRLNGKIPTTFTVRTGTGGLHLYFKYTDDLKNLGNITKIIGLPFDYRTNGGVAVFPGSISKGKEYAVESGYIGGKPIIAEMPIWIKTLLVMDRLQKEDRKEATPENIAEKAASLGIRL